MVILKVIDFYLLKKFFGALIVTILAIGLTITVVNIIDELRYFIDNDVSLFVILQYYFYFAGWVIKQFMPMFVLLATLFSFSLLGRKNELLAMKASGLSLYRISWPILVVALLLSIGHIYFNEVLYPPVNEKRLQIKEFNIRKQSPRNQTHVNNVYRQIAPGYFYTISQFNITRREGENLKIYQKSQNRLANVTTAKKIIFKNNAWQAVNGMVRMFDDTTYQSFFEFDSMLIPDIKDDPADFAKPLGRPEDMSYAQLKEYIDLMKRTGGPYLHEAIDLKIKIAYPLTSVVVVLLSIPFAANPKRGGIARSFAIGALISLSYFVLFRVLQSAGYSEKIPEDLAVWGVNGLFLIVGLAAMIGARK